MGKRPSQKMRVSIFVGVCIGLLFVILSALLNSIRIYLLILGLVVLLPSLVLFGIALFHIYRAGGQKER